LLFRIVSGQALEQFEQDRNNNLYKLWNVCDECGKRVMCR
jgi:hypothetical protein